MLLELHILQNLAPSNINRDEAGAPKSAWFAGHLRQRVSSQSWKRAMRERFAQTLDPALLATRTRRIDDALILRLPQYTPAQIHEAALVVFADLMKLTDGLAPYLLFLSDQELTLITDLCVRQINGQGERRAALMPILNHGQAVDLALFGRMIADRPSAHIEAACHVAHALSTNRVPSSDTDYFTAIDDLQSAATTGAAMLGTTEFAASCLYRYVSVDGDQLLANLGGDHALADQALRAFIDAFIQSMPQGKQHGFATFTPPSVLLGVVRTSTQRWQLINAFAKPCRPTPDQDLIAISALALDAYWTQVSALYGTDDIRHVALAQVGDLSMPTLGAQRVATSATWIATLATAMQEVS